KSPISLKKLQGTPYDGNGTERRRGDEEHRGHRGQATDQDGVDPFGRDAIASPAFGGDAVPVESAGNDGKKELQTAAGEAGDDFKSLEPRLAGRRADSRALVERVAASGPTDLGLVRGPEG